MKHIIWKEQSGTFTAFERRAGVGLVELFSVSSLPELKTKAAETFPGERVQFYRHITPEDYFAETAEPHKNQGLRG